MIFGWLSMVGMGIGFLGIVFTMALLLFFVTSSPRQKAEAA
jgi:hypothetical protein